MMTPNIELCRTHNVRSLYSKPENYAACGREQSPSTLSWLCVLSMMGADSKRVSSVVRMLRTPNFVIELGNSVGSR